jgi:hypothetical protein
MKVAIISTMSGFPWGGSEELWASTAIEAIKEGLELAVSIWHGASIPHKFSGLQKDGVQLFRRRPPLKFGRVERILSRVASPFHEIFHFNPDVICISQGSTYESLLFRAASPGVWKFVFRYPCLKNFFHNCLITNDLKAAKASLSPLKRLLREKLA